MTAEHTSALSSAVMAGPGISRRVAGLKPSVTVAVAQTARAMRAAGEDVIGFTLGEPDFDTPDFIKEAAIKALRDGQTKYIATLGDRETREVIAHKLVNENGIDGLTWEHVAISAGAKQALFVLMHCLFDTPTAGEPAGQLLLPTPTWVSYEPIAELAGAEVVPLATMGEDGFQISPERIADAITPLTRAVVLCTPSNPCGTMYSEDDLRAIGRVIEQAASDRAPGLIVIVDEIYEKLVYAGARHFSLGSIPEIAERVVTINGMSKAYAMTGWRAGYCGCPGEFGKRLIEAMGTLQGQISTNTTSFILPAIREAIREGSEDVERMRSAFEARSHVMGERLRAIPGLKVSPIQGAIYAFPDVSAHFGKVSPDGAKIESSLTFCDALLREQKLAVIPGEDFGPPGERHIRLSFACDRETIERGTERLDAFVRSLK